MTFSSNQIGDIAYLYENVVHGEQEVLDEGAADLGVGVRKAVGTAAKGYADVVGSQLRGFAGQTTTSTNPLARAGNAVTRAVSAPSRAGLSFAKGLVTGQGDKAAPSKYKSSSDGKMYANYNDALAARNSRLKSGAGSSGGSGGAGAPANPAAGAPAGPKVLPTKPAAPAKPAGSAMDQWAKANPKLAAAKAERDRTRGTSATTNPLMKDMKSSLPAPAAKPEATPSLGQKAAAMPSLGSSQYKAAPEIKKTADIAAAPKPAPVAPATRKEPLWNSYQYEDAYDLVLEYLFDNGHVDTVDEAHYVMMELDAEVIQEIVEEVLEEGDNYDKNRKRAAQRAAARNAARDAGQTGNVPGVGYVTPRRERETYRDSAGTERHKTGARMPEKKN